MKKIIKDSLWEILMTLENRIKNIEYYSIIIIRNRRTKSSNTRFWWFDRFKNGFVVDNFTGHNIGDVGNNDYKLAIDR